LSRSKHNRSIATSAWLSVSLALVAGLSCFPVSAAPAKSSTSSSRKVATQAGALLKQRNYKVAIATLEAALKKDPDCEALHQQLGKAYYGLGISLMKSNHDAARNAICRSIFHDQNLRGNSYALGLALGPVGKPGIISLAEKAAAKGEPEEAIILYSQILELESNEEVREKRKQLVDKLGLKSWPPNWTRHTRGVDFTDYMATLQRWARSAWQPARGESRSTRTRWMINKDGTIANVRISQSSGSADEDRRAIEAVETAAPFRPLPEGAPDKIEVEFTFDYNNFSKNWKSLPGREINNLREYELGKKSFAAGDYKSAAEHFEAACKQSPDRSLAVIRGHLADACLCIGDKLIKDDPEGALLWYRKAHNADPGYERARQAVEKAMVATGFDPKSVDSVLEFAIKLEAEGHRDQALEEYRRAYKLKADPQINRKIADLTEFVRAMRDAERWQNVLKAQPRSTDALLGLALCLKKAGKKDDAVEQLKKILEIDPNHKRAQAEIAGLETKEQ